MFSQYGSARLATLLLALLFAGGFGWAADVNQQYIRIHDIIDQAETLEKSGKPDAANSKYRAAYAALQELQRDNPNWNTKMVSFRLNYVAGKIAAHSQPAAPVVTGETAVVTTEKGPAHKVSSLPAGVLVRVLGPGATPRKVMFLQPKPDEKQTSVVTAKSTMSMNGGGMQGEKMTMPLMKMTLSALVRNTSPEGDIGYDLRIEDVQVEAETGTATEMVEEMKKSLGPVRGLAVQCVVTDRGFIKKAEAATPAGASSEAKEAIKEMEEAFASEELILPKEAIGVGARWEVRQKIKSEGMVVDQVATHQLTAIEGDVLTIKSSVVESAANQKIVNPLAPESKADLVRMTGTSSTTTTMDLTKIMPLQGTVEERSEVTLAADVGGQKQTITMKSDSNTRFESK